MSELVIAGTGHRPNKLVGGYSDFGRELLVGFAFETLCWYTWEGTHDITVISGMAQGWDQALAEAAVTLGIPFWAAVPFLGQELAWPAEAQERYRTLLDAAQMVHVVCDGGYAAWKMQKRNEWMVDQLSAAGPQGLLLPLWNGSSGGTANAVKYAYDDRGITKGNFAVHNCWKHYLEFCTDRGSREPL